MCKRACVRMYEGERGACECERACVCACACLSVCEMDSSAFPCLSSFLPTSSQSSNFLDSIPSASPKPRGPGGE